MPYEIETKLANYQGRMLDVFIFYNIVSNGYHIDFNPAEIAFNPTFKHTERTQLEAIHCFDFDNEPYYPTPEDFALWIDTVKDLIQTHYRKVA